MLCDTTCDDILRSLFPCSKHQHMGGEGQDVEESECARLHAYDSTNQTLLRFALPVDFDSCCNVRARTKELALENGGMCVLNSTHNGGHLYAARISQEQQNTVNNKEQNQNITPPPTNTTKNNRDRKRVMFL